MKFTRAVQAMKEGKKVRRPYFDIASGRLNAFSIVITAQILAIF